jgi:tetratricopeptide (TPR) repeat protein
VTDNPRIEELQRRVQKDPASIAFAQLAEEYRRASHYDEAVRVCRTGLAKHPSYLSARVTLGRALIELAQYEEAQTELDYVLRSAPENLAAIRGLAEIHQRRGELGEALKQYQAALAIAKHDPELEESVHELTRQLGGHPAVAQPSARAESRANEAARSAPLVTPPPIPLDLNGTKFSVGTPAPQGTNVAAPAPAPSALSPELEAAADEFTRALEALDSLAIDVPAPPLPDNTFAMPDLKRLDQEPSMEEQLGLAGPSPTLAIPDVAAAPPAADPQIPDLPAPDAGALSELEDWLAAIDTERDTRKS